MALIPGSVMNDLVDGQNADAGDVTIPLLAILAVINGGIESINLATDSVTTAKILNSNVTAAKLADSAISGWKDLSLTPSSVTALGQRSYNVVYNSIDYTGILSKGMRFRGQRSSAAPTQCTTLNGTTQYFSKSSPNKLTFTDDFVVSAWVKMTAYPASNAGLVSRYNGTSGWILIMDSTGRPLLAGYNGGAANVSYVAAQQSVPLNRWVQITAQLDMSAFTATPTTSYVMLDGVDVPAAVTRGGTNPTALVQAGNLEVGSFNAGAFFGGKIAQAAVFSAKVSQATMLTYISQGLTGSESSLASAYSFNNSIADLNTTTPNDLTANAGAVATTADSPFAQGNSAGLLEYGIITNVAFSTNTTVTVQVPEGSMLPTSGGLAATSYAAAANPLSFPSSRFKWQIISRLRYNPANISIGGTNQWTSGNHALTVPIGAWELSYQGSARFDSSVSGNRSGFVTLANSPVNNDYAGEMVSRNLAVASTVNITTWARSSNVDLTVATVYTLYGAIDSSTGVETWAPNGGGGALDLIAECAYL